MSFLNSKFLEVPEDGKIVTDSFLNSCSDISAFFDSLGTVFSPVKKDVQGNIDKIKKRMLENPEKFRTLDLIIDTEKTETDKSLKQGDQGIATNALMWLRRGLLYISRFFHHLLDKDYVDNPTEENLEKLKNCACMAYEESLKKYHGWIIGGVFTLAMKAAPNRTKLLKSIGGEESTPQQTLEAIKDFTVNFDATIATIVKLYQDKGVECEYTV